MLQGWFYFIIVLKEMLNEAFLYDLCMLLMRKFCVLYKRVPYISVCSFPDLIVHKSIPLMQGNTVLLTASFSC